MSNMLSSKHNRKGKTVTCPWGCCGRGLTGKQVRRHQRHAEARHWRRQVADQLADEYARGRPL